MSIKSVIGASVAVGTTIAAANNINSISNANPAVAALATTTGLASQDEVVIASSWDRLNDRVTKITLSGSDATLLNVNTTDTGLFPAGAGATNATLKEVTAWTTLGQIKEWTSSGGEQEYEDITTIADYVKKQKPTQKSPVVFDMTIFWDPNLAWWAAIIAASESQSQYPLRITLAGGNIIYGQGYVSLGKIPSITGTSLTTRFAMSISSELTVF